jgi:type IX secretion system substrate protein
MKTLITRIACIVLIQLYASALFAHVEIDYPQGGETLISGSTITIQWHIAIPHDQLNWDILFSPDGGATWEFIQMDLPVSNLSYQWVIPNIVTSQARISVIQDNNGMDYQDESMNFSIAPPAMLPVIVLEAMDIVIESNIDTQDDAIQDWLDNQGGATVTSFCENLNWTNDYFGLTMACGYTGNAVVTFIAEDDCGSTETIATVTVIDTTPPVLIQEASPMVVECDGNGNNTQFYDWIGIQGGAIASDASGNMNWFASFSGTQIICGSTTIRNMTFFAADDCDNNTSTTASFTVEDHTIPDIQIPAMDTTIECGLPNSQAVLESWLDRQGGAIANDVCGSVTWTNNFSGVPDTCNGSTSLSVRFIAFDQCGNIDSTIATLTLLGTSGTTTTDHEVAGFTLFPNPVSDMLKIIVDQPHLLLEHITLYDACGKPVLTLKDVSGEISIPVNEYAPGVYLVQGQSTHGVMTRKVIIE